MTEPHSAEPFPLYWPESWPRSTVRKRAAYRVTFVQARTALARELRLLGATRVIISTNLPLRRDGLPLAPRDTEPNDVGVAVYWLELSNSVVERVIACDQWTRVRDNVRAIGLAIEALRALQRSGASQILDRMLVGLNVPQLAAANPRRTWRDVFGIHPIRPVSRADIDAMYRELAPIRHPDRGGSHEQIVELNAAYQQALAELSNGATVSP